MSRNNKDINKEASIPTLSNPCWVEAPGELSEALRKEYNSIVKELFILGTASMFASPDYSKVLSSRFEQLWGRLEEIRMLITPC